MTISKHEEKLENARAYVLFKAPYYSSVLYGFIFVPSTISPTMLSTNRMVLGYSPSWVEMATIEELGADIVHEIHHFLRDSFGRGAGFSDKELWNIASDLAINTDLTAEGWKLCSDPKKRPAVWPKNFGLPEGKTAEEYYHMLQQKKASGGFQPPEEPGICSGKCGSIGGKDPSAEEEALNKSSLGRSDIELVGIQTRAASEIKAHYNKGRGNVPFFMKEFLDSMAEESFVRWEDELGHIIRSASGRIQAGGHDFSLARPSRRSPARGIVRPGMIEYLPELGIVLDTSGSMGEKQLVRAAREAYAIAQTLGIDEVLFCEADAAVSQEWQRVGPDFFRALAISGRGGTDFRPAIESAQNLSPPIDILVYLTDGDGCAPEEEPANLAVVWGIVPSYYNRAPASWGHTVIISDDPAVRNQGPEERTR